MNSAVIGIGSPIVDLLARVDDKFIEAAGGGKGGMMLVEASAMADLCNRLPEEPERAPGGSAANTIRAMAGLGRDTWFLGTVGDDETGRFYRDRLEYEGVHADRIRVISARPTGRCLSLITPDSQRTMRTCLGAAQALCPEMITADDFTGCALAHIEGYLLYDRQTAVKAIESAREAGCAVSLDLGSFEVVEAAGDILPDLLRDDIDIVFANEDEAKAFIGRDDPEAALEALLKLTPTAAVKLGPRGALMGRGDERVFVPAESVDAVDTTGAGDCWAAGFLHGWLDGRSLRWCGQAGALLGAETVTRIGAVPPMDALADIRRRLEKLNN
ncbi:MAG TPA: adenosine kinase [Candidatus Hydrogenedentes bacterium]|nr:adenosine kinase [Candidatus Hydrogenedentota bacterium]HPU98092.1 adenosine kinase [Candidatus Hydrogenedentota bacterium]